MSAVRGLTSPPLQMCQPGAQRLDEEQPAGDAVELLPSVAQLGLAEAGMAGKIPGSDQAPEQPAMRGKRTRSVKASRVPSAQPPPSMLITATQRPLAQIDSAPQTVPQAPQLFRSSPRSVQRPPHRVAPLEHEAAQRPPEHTWPEGQTVPHAPQLFESLPSDAHALPHRVDPKGQAQAPAVQVPLAGHARPHMPQCWTLVAVAASQPLAALPSQLAKPAAQVPTPHAPATQVAVPLVAVQARLHMPQWVRLVRVSTSQPLAGLPSQSAKPALQAPIAQVPAAQMAAALGKLHARPHMPQWAALVRVSASQPLAALPSQLAKFAAQAVRVQAPAVHAPVPLAGAQARPHAPQFAMVSRVVSQPLAALPSQLPRPAAQATPQVPALHVAVPPAGVGQALLQAPQWASEVRVSVSQPLAALPSQLPRPVMHMPPHAPAVQVATPPAEAGQRLPQVPQWVGLVWRFWQSPSQQVWPAAHGADAEQPTVHDPARQMRPAPHWVSAVHSTQARELGSQRGRVEKGQLESSRQPSAQVPPAVQYSERGQWSLVWQPSTHWRRVLQ